LTRRFRVYLASISSASTSLAQTTCTRGLSAERLASPKLIQEEERSATS
jgi:hypothetical protein